MIENRQLKELGVITLSANGHSSIINTKAYRIVTLSVGVDATADLTLQVKGATESHQTTDVDLTAAQGLSNRWDYILVKDRQDDAGIKGDDGLVFTGVGADSRLVEVNANALDKIALEVSGYTAGNVTIVVSGYSNA